MAAFKDTLSDIKYDFPEGRINLRLFITHYLYNPRFRVLLNHRLGKYFSKSNLFILRQIGNSYKTTMVRYKIK